MKARSTCRPTCCVRASRAHAAMHPSCNASPPELRYRSARGPEDAEGKIEGDGTATRPELGLHGGSRGTGEECPRAALRWNPASLLGLPRAVFAAVCRAAMELRHDQP